MHFKGGWLSTLEFIQSAWKFRIKEQKQKWSAMPYGMEAVPLNKGYEKTMKVAEMRMLRFTLENTRLDRILNTTARKIIGVRELEED